MALNPQYDAIGKAFVQQYYTLFDDANQRHQLVNLYNVSVIVLNFKSMTSSIYSYVWSLSKG